MAKADNGILTVNYHKELDAKMIEWVKSKRNYSGYIRDLLYKEMEKEQVIQQPSGIEPIKILDKEEVKVNRSILTSIDNM